MAGLFSTLSATAHSMDAQQLGMEAVGQNMANANTPGYARRQVNLAEVPQGIDGSAGGVTVESIQAVRSLFTFQRLIGAQSLSTAQGATADLSELAQSSLGTIGASLDRDLSSFFDAWSALASNPTSTTARQGVILQAQALGGSFAQIADQLSAVQEGADVQVRTTVADIDALASQIASLNASIAAVGSSSVQGQAIQDQLFAAASELSQKIGINVVVESDGQFNVSYAGGRALVIGANTYGLSVSNGPNGLAEVRSADGVDVTASLTSGQIGGALNVRDTAIPAYLNQLDTLAYTLVQQVNTIHTGGFDAGGGAGGNFFAPIASVAGAASAVSVNAAIAADPSKIAAAGTTATGDNQNARAMVALAAAPVLSGGTLSNGWTNLVYRIGQDTKVAQNSRDTYVGVVSQLQALSDSVSGVSVNEEAATLLKFLRAYQANAQFFSTVNSAINALFDMAR